MYFKTLLNFLLLFLFAQFTNAQECVQIDYFGEPHNVNCGGEDCVECLSIPYNLICDESGIFNVIISISDAMLSEEDESMGYYLVSTGNFNDEIEDAGQFISFIESEGTPILLQMSKFDADGNLIAYGEINELSPPCSKGTENDNCPPDSNYNVDSDLIYFEDYYMVKYTISNGTKPYKIYDNLLGQFYNASVNTDEYYLGSFPYETFLNTTIIDANGCNLTFIISAEPPGTSGGGTDSTTSDTEIKNNDYSIFPNQFQLNQNQYINISVPNGGFFTLDFVGINGQVLDKVDFQALANGTYAFPIDFIGYNTNMYFAILKDEVGNIVITQKLFILN